MARMSASGQALVISALVRGLWGGMNLEDLQSTVKRWPWEDWQMASTVMEAQEARKHGIRRLMHSAANRCSVR